jgi:predicted ATPase
MAQLKALGGLRLEGTAFTRPTPLLLLTYLSLEGSQQRRHLAELFWQDGNRMKSLSMTLTRLRQGAREVIEADEKRVWSTLKSDAKELLESLDKSHWYEASELYTGAFLEDVVLEDWSSELEEWVYTTREYLAERVQYALLNLSEEVAKKRDFDKARELAERACKLPGLGGTEVSSLKRLYPLLSASSSLLAPEVRKELDSYGIALQLSRDEARAIFQPSKAASHLPTRQTSFVGRDVELTELATMLANVQLLTLLGTAGVGKTRLALQLAHEQQKLGTFEQVYFVSLESLSSAELILPTVLSALGLTPQRDTEPLVQLAEFIAEHSILLVLDNLEHLIDNVQVLANLIQHCPSLKVLVTSRERLGLEEEHLFPLEGLAFPTPDVAFEEARTFDAVTLFRERAQQLQPQFELKKNLEAVLRICKLVEGLPLGLELAASWVRLMSCAEIANEIERNLEFLATTTRNVPERHRSLKAAFEYSWKLLNQKEREVLRNLSVFVGGFRREAASEVAGATIPLLASLVDKSLLRVLPNGRYDRHPLLYQFTHEKLTENVNEQLEIEAKHTAFFLHFAENAARHFHSNARGHWLQRLDEELDNIRTVISRAILEQDAVTGLNLVTDLPEFWFSRGLQQEIRKYLEIFLDAASIKNTLQCVKGLNMLAHLLLQQGDVETALSALEEALLRGKTLGDSSVLSKTLELLARIYHFNLADPTLAKSFYEQSIALAEQVDNKVRKASSLNFLANLVSEQGDFESARTFYEESLRLWRSLGHTSGAAWVINNIASLFDYRRDFNRAGLLFKESLDLFRELGEKDGIATTLANFGANEMKQHRYEQAKSFLEESLELATTLEDKRLMAYVLRGLGEGAFFQGDHETAHTLYTKSYALYAQFGYTHGISETLGNLGQLFHQRREWDKAEHNYLEALSLARSKSDVAALSHLTCNLALLYLDEGKYELADTLLLESLDAAKQISSPGAIVLALEGFAIFATLTGKLERAALLWGKTDAKRQELNFFRNHLEEARYHTSNKHVQQKLKHFSSMYQRGENLELEQVLELLEGLDSRAEQSTKKVALTNHEKM